MARLEGSLQKLMDRLAKTDLLILDDFGIVRLEQQQRLDLMEIFEDRHGRKATIIAIPNYPVAYWYDYGSRVINTIDLTIYSIDFSIYYGKLFKGYDNNMDM
jgi:DNA replication protein DnaC